MLALSLLFGGGARAQSWVQRVAGTGLGNPLTVNPLNHDILYGAAGSSRVYVSRDQGYHWSAYGQIIPGNGTIKSIAVSPLDTAKLLAGVEMSSGGYDRIVRSTDAGETWIDVWAGTFSYYGQPVEFVPEHPDTVYAMGADTLWRSIDFGATWDTVARVPAFNTWCDMSIRPDSAGILLLGDNTSGIWKSTNGGLSWTQKYATLGEIPSVAIDPFNPRTAYASKYGGGGGLVKTTNGGETWANVTVPSLNRDTWWVTCSRTQPGWVYYGTYTGDTSLTGVYLSRNSGASWTRYGSGLYPSALLNYGLLAVDSLAVVALQGSGLYRLQFPTAAHVTAPNGGEIYQSGTVRSVQWTSAYLPLVRLEYSTDGGGSWTQIADSLPPSASPYAWTIPAANSSLCKVRVADARFSGVSDMTDGTFTIATALMSVSAPAPADAWPVGAVKTITWSAQGVATAHLELSTDDGASWSSITDVTASSGAYPWTVPDLPSGSCRVRLTDITDSLIRAVSPAFSIVARDAFVAHLVVQDNGAGMDTLHFGNAAGATDLIDPALGETELPSLPAPGVFDVRWLISGTNGTRVDVRDTLGLAHDRARFLLVACAFQSLGEYTTLLYVNLQSHHSLSQRARYILLRCQD